MRIAALIAAARKNGNEDKKKVKMFHAIQLNMQRGQDLRP
jgi:hypothetical protein